MNTSGPPSLSSPGAPADRVALDEILARARVLALKRFPTMTEALQAFFEMAAQLSYQAWPEPVAPAPKVEPAGEDGEAAEVEAEPVPDPQAARAELLLHLERMEELLEALTKT